MSIENHPNFHAVNFTTQITAAFYESLRGDANKDNAPDITDAIVEFVARIENRVDSKVWFCQETGCTALGKTECAGTSCKNG